MNKGINERFFDYILDFAWHKRKEKGHIKNVTGKTKNQIYVAGMS